MEDFFQFSVFDTTKQPFKIDKPIRLIELFAGIGSQAKALERLGVDFEHYRICEFDKYAVASYNAVHGTNFATSDITKITAKDLGIVDTYKYLYMMTYSFPCQDLSLAGKQKGMAKGDDTRSGLLWEVERLLNECTELPQVLLMENVTQVHGTKNKEHFDEWIKFLESKGYSNYWKDLNAKKFGIPQNRNRTFMVSVLGNYTYEFPKEFPLELRLKDMLEDSVDEKFYISNERVDKIVENLPQINNTTTGLVTKQATEFKKLTNVSNTLMARDYKGFGNQEMNRVIEPIRLGGLYDDEKGKHQAGSIWDKDGLSPTVDTMQGGNRQPLVVDEPQVIGGIGEKKSNGGRQWYLQDRVYDNNIATSVTTGFNPYYKVEEPTIQRVDIPQTVRVRKYPIDTEKLVVVLREHKTLSNQEIAEKLNVPLTKVEHWFRKDEYFAIPDAEIWSALKALLKIETDEFDKAITVFEEKEGVFEKANRCYFTDGIAPTLLSASADEKIIEPQERFFKQAVETLEENDCSVGDTVDAYNKRVNKSGISPTITTRPEGFKTAILPVVEPLAYDEQNGYIRKDGCVGTLTTDGSSPKHNNRVIENCYVSEKGVRFICSPKRGMATDVNAEISQPLTAKGQQNWTGSFISPDIESLEKSSTIGSTEPTKINLKNGETVYFDGENFSPEIIREEPLEREGWHEYAKEVLSAQGVCRTLSTQSNNLATKVKEPCSLRIRKLTPRECWRLMGVKDEHFEKVAKNQSNSSLYHLAGDSIVVDVLYYIFKQMFAESEAQNGTR